MAGIESPAKLLYLQMRHRRPRTQRQGGTKKKEKKSHSRRCHGDTRRLSAILQPETSPTRWLVPID